MQTNIYDSFPVQLFSVRHFWMKLASGEAVGETITSRIGICNENYQNNLPFNWLLPKISTRIDHIHVTSHYLTDKITYGLLNL